jgi:Domain of unknown function (DUF4129)
VVLYDGVTERKPNGLAEAVIRVAGVLLLLGLAAVGLSGRRDLDWAALTAAPGSTWVGLALISGATFVVVSVALVVRRILRDAEDEDAAAVSLDGPRPIWPQFVVLLVIAVGAVLVYLLLKNGTDLPLRNHQQGALTGNGHHLPGDGSDHSAINKWTLLIAVLVGAAIAVGVATVRRRADTSEELPDDEQQPAEPGALAEAVAAAEMELDSHGDDTRAAIIAAYLAMERHLAATGTARQVSDTPTDLLLRAMSASRVSTGAATRLTDLFREARFSTHPMAPTARADAVRALARVADDLSHQAGPRG